MKAVVRGALTGLAVVGAVGVVGALAVPRWQVAATAVAAATPEEIWEWYADSAKTTHWDPMIKERIFTGPFAQGAAGTIQSVDGPAMPWRLTEVEQHRSFTDVTMLPLATLTGIHVLTPVEGGTRIEHALIIAGPLAWLYQQLFADTFAIGVNDAVDRLVASVGSGVRV